MKIQEDRKARPVLLLGCLTSGDVFGFTAGQNGGCDYGPCLALGIMTDLTNSLGDRQLWCSLKDGLVYTRTRHDARTVYLLEHSLRVEPA